MNDEQNQVADFVASLAPFLRGEVLPASERFAWPTIQLSTLKMQILFRGPSWGNRGKYSASAYPVDQSNTRPFASANFSPDRPLVTLARDIKRRVIEPARAKLAEHYQSQAKAAAAAVSHEQDLQQLEQALGGKRNSGYYGRHFVCRGLSIEREYYLHGCHFKETTAEIRVKSFAALLQICRIMRDDWELAEKQK